MKTQFRVPIISLEQVPPFLEVDRDRVVSIPGPKFASCFTVRHIVLMAASAFIVFWFVVGASAYLAERAKAMYGSTTIHEKN
ncbi:MAG: hypothetical protein Q8P35_03350 [Candidatus Yanofskybacteria bacterium]|nr:hypothetical protein [Candidatus Yanofskybacteria bacterium]